MLIIYNSYMTAFCKINLAPNSLKLFGFYLGGCSTKLISYDIHMLQVTFLLAIIFQ